MKDILESTRRPTVGQKVLLALLAVGFVLTEIAFCMDRIGLVAAAMIFSVAIGAWLYKIS